MREILFRGKIIELCEYQGQWLEGFYAVENGKPFIAIIKENGLNGFYCDPETIGQYTGLTDKNGNKIFEGDVVKYKIIVLSLFGKMEYKETKSVVEYNAPCFSPFEADLYEDYVMPEEAEVIGNIHDNPKLVEG